MKHLSIRVGIFMTTLSLFLAIVMSVITVQIKRLVWQTDKVIPSMLIFMCCALYSLALFFILVNILSETVWLDLTCSKDAPVAFKLFYGYATWSPSYFLGAGCMLNLNKWVYFYMRI